jgi:hypothetical protein
MEPVRTVNECINCHKTLAGRRDKKYCDAHCKAEYHNQNKTFGELYIASVQSKTRHNRRILKTLSPEGKSTVRKEVLDQMGYDYNYFSGIFKTQKGVYYLVYDYAFSPVNTDGVDRALIVQRQDYMDKLSFEIWKKPKP